jgi:hypothetical protein
VVAGGRDSVTHYETLEPFPSAGLLRVHLETGRTHQIRARSLAFSHTPRTGGGSSSPAHSPTTLPTRSRCSPRTDHAPPNAGVRLPCFTAWLNFAVNSCCTCRADVGLT